MFNARALIPLLLVFMVSCRMQEARTLSITATPQSDPAPADAQAQQAAILAAFDLARGAGAGGVLMSWNWQELEPSAGQFNLDSLASTLDYLGNTEGFNFLVTLRLIDTSTREVPPDLASEPFDSALMKQRFHAFFDALVPHLNPHVRYLSLGNEVDVYLARTGEWAAYEDFYKDAVAYVHARAAWLQVGVTTTFDGANAKSPQDVAALNGPSDVFILTYYPVDGSFVAEPARAPLTDLPRAESLAGGRPLVMQEVGYPSSTAISSSEQQQADFVSNVFTAWASLQKAPYLNFSLMHDYSPDACANLPAFYGMAGNTNFQAFLCSIGLRQANGQPKLAWSTLVQQASSSGVGRAH